MPPMPCQVGWFRQLKTVRFSLLSDKETGDVHNSEQTASGRAPAGTGSATPGCGGPKPKHSPHA
jgi:hypothetical protein